MLFSAIIKENVTRIMVDLGDVSALHWENWNRAGCFGSIQTKHLGLPGYTSWEPRAGDSVRMWWPLGTNNGGTLKKQLLACKVGNETHCQLLCS